MLAHNQLAGRLITDFHAEPAGERNLARFVFLDPHARELYRDWPTVAATTAAMLRLDAGRHPDDPLLASLIGDLSIHSSEFRRHWSANKVHQRTTGTKQHQHPLVGDLTVTYQALTPDDAPEQTLFVYSASPDSPSEAALQLLAGWQRTAPVNLLGLGPAPPLRTGPVGEGVQVGALGVLEVERGGQGVEDLCGGAAAAALLQAGVVVHADPGQPGELLPAQPGHPAGPRGRLVEPGPLRAQPGTCRAQESRQRQAGVITAHVTSVPPSSLERGRRGWPHLSPERCAPAEPPRAASPLVPWVPWHANPAGAKGARA